MMHDIIPAIEFSEKQT